MALVSPYLTALQQQQRQQAEPAAAPARDPNTSYPVGMPAAAPRTSATSTTTNPSTGLMSTAMKMPTVKKPKANFDNFLAAYDYAKTTPYFGEKFGLEKGMREYQDKTGLTAQLGEEQRQRRMAAAQTTQPAAPAPATPAAPAATPAPAEAPNPQAQPAQATQTQPRQYSQQEMDAIRRLSTLQDLGQYTQNPDGTWTSPSGAIVNNAYYNTLKKKKTEYEAELKGGIVQGVGNPVGKGGWREAQGKDDDLNKWNAFRASFPNPKVLDGATIDNWGRVRLADGSWLTGDKVRQLGGALPEAKPTYGNPSRAVAGRTQDLNAMLQAGISPQTYYGMSGAARSGLTSLLTYANMNVDFRALEAQGKDVSGPANVLFAADAPWARFVDPQVRQRRGLDNPYRAAVGQRAFEQWKAQAGPDWATQAANYYQRGAMRTGEAQLAARQKMAERFGTGSPSTSQEVMNFTKNYFGVGGSSKPFVSDYQRQQQALEQQQRIQAGGGFALPPNYKPPTKG